MISLENLSAQYNTFVLRIALLITAVAIIAYSEILERLDFVIYDELSSLIQYPQDSDTIIVAIDEESLGVLGRWPWSRGIHAELINRLKSIDNKKLALDLLFSELQNHDSHADELLATAIAAHGNVILPVAPLSAADPDSIYLAAPHPLFRQYAVLGHVDVELDSDGVARRVFLYAGINEPAWPALALLLADPTTARKPHGLNNEYKQSTDPLKHWFRSNEILIPYAGKSGSFRQVSYASVLFNDDILASLKDKTVIVGMTAAGLGARFTTPVSPINRQLMTGVEWHANVYSMLQNNRAIHALSKPWTAVLSVLWISIILMGISWAKRNLTIPLLSILLMACLFIIYHLLKIHHIWISPSAALLGTVAIYPLWNWQRINQFLSSFLISSVRSSTALEAIRDGVIITDAHNHVVYINKGAEHILKSEFNQIKGKALQQILHLNSKHENPICVSAIKNILTDGSDSFEALECSLITTQGNELTVRITQNQLYDQQKIRLGSVIAMTDISDTVELTQRIAHQEHYDRLTKLPNRSTLLSRFDQMIQATQDTGKIFTVFFVTLDNFKKINDAMGHQAGDKLLKMVSRRLYGVLHHDDFIARWGGDEFILLFDYLSDTDSASEMAQKILDVINQRFEIDELEVFVSASIGICFYPKNGQTSEAVLERAGTAMYRAKRDGGNRFEFYSSKSTEVWTRDRLEMEKELRSAIKNNELQVLFQPIINAETHHIARMEALVRWPHPTRGYLSPSEFIPLAENAGLIEQLGELVLSVSCSAAHQLLKLGYPVKISVNVNPRQLLHANFLQTIVSILQHTNLPSHSLILEITESTIINDIDRVGGILKKIKELEILIALDDFGTGYSSLTLLRELPIDILKIDKSFVRTLDQNQNDLKIVQAIIGLSINMGLIVVAEGVETVQQTKILLQHQCYYQQGYYFSRPVPYNALLALININNKNTGKTNDAFDPAISKRETLKG
ncbi:MAG: EAL domain-containing protein [Burkholderiales bacterium]|nr:EAL domain-containing protein [Burkholderiales bacterium]MDR4518094.1 EAL domain-containing protein [Nitrosomonas sp.]